MSQDAPLRTVGADWSLIADAMNHYRAKGYVEVEVPWTVPYEHGAVTAPTPERQYPFDGEVLVGSAEQSFLSLSLRNLLPHGRYVACTPCFRREPSYDRYHLPYFMKVELFESGEVDLASANRMISDAQTFFADKLQTVPGVDLRVVATSEGHDIELDGIELGSYGVRQIAGLRWAYGTGLAEPRFSTVKRECSARARRALAEA